MKTDKIFSILIAALLSGALALGALGCLVTGFGLPLENEAGLYLLCGISGILFSLLATLRWGPAVTACLAAFLAGWLWHRGIFLEQLLSLLVRISRVYHDAYQWGYFLFAEADHAADLPLAVLGSLIALAAAFPLVRDKAMIFPLFLAALPLAATMVVTDTVPDKAFLFLFLAACLLCLIPQSVRRENMAQGCRLTVQVALPVLLALGALFLAAPQEGYVNRSEHIQAAILNRLEELPQLAREKAAALSAGRPDNESRNLNLKAIGPRPRYTNPVLEVTADTGGLLYLRGQDFDAYTGTGWTASPHRAEYFGTDEPLTHTLSLSARSAGEIQYLPYYPSRDTILAGGSLKNAENQRQYTHSYTPLPENWQQALEEAEGAGGTRIEYTQLELSQFGSTADRLRYLTLPGETKVAAEALLETILPEDPTRWEAAEAIAEFVKNSAEYDLNTPRMDPESEDFALWFLEDADTGYCVHFATAAVVLLRAADIPARYVTGYLVQTQPGQAVTVTAGDAHAWAEYYVPQLETWVVLEATPTEEILEQVPTPSLAPEATETVPLPTEGLPTEAPAPASQTEAPILPQEAQPVPQEETFYGWLLPLLAVLLLWSQRKLRLRLRKQRFDAGDANRRALARWQEVSRLAKLSKAPPPEELHQLAQKAKYSQHRLTVEELDRFDTFLGEKIAGLKQDPWYRRLAYRWVFVVY